MRQPDLNRVNKALYHIDAAKRVLDSIKWENISMMESSLKQQAVFNMDTSISYLKDIINIQPDGK